MDTTLLPPPRKGIGAGDKREIAVILLSPGEEAGRGGSPFQPPLPTAGAEPSPLPVRSAL